VHRSEEVAARADLLMAPKARLSSSISSGVNCTCSMRRISMSTMNFS
jgi:hypothetical protein